MPPQLCEVHWELTNRCNLRCKHCLPASGDPRPGELSLGEAEAAMAQFERAGAARLYLTGGEPFTRPDIWQILESAAKRFSVEVITNGTLLAGPDLDRLRDLRVGLGVSLDGIGDTHDAIRGRGVFTKAVSVLVGCRLRGIPTRLYTTIMRGNFRQLYLLASLAQQCGCTGIHFSELTVAGRAQTYAGELALDDSDRRDLAGKVSAVVAAVYGSGLSGPDTRCWVDGSAIYMTADGSLYVCSEVFQRDPSLAFGNIRTLNLAAWLDGFPASPGEQECCYGAWGGPAATLMAARPQPCAYVPAPIRDLAQLHAELDRLYAGIERDCKECQDPDCMGYIWVLRQEADRLLERGIPLVRINGNVDLIHSFPESESGSLDLTKRYPRCGQYCEQTGRCLIHEDRPLVCHLYPLGLETTAEGKVVWAIHEDCLHIRRLREQDRLAAFGQKARAILDRIAPELLEEILATYRAVDEISSFPDGDNAYTILKEACHV